MPHCAGTSRASVLFPLRDAVSEGLLADVFESARRAAAQPARIFRTTISSISTKPVAPASNPPSSSSFPGAQTPRRRRRSSQQTLRRIHRRRRSFPRRSQPPRRPALHESRSHRRRASGAARHSRTPHRSLRSRPHLHLHSRTRTVLLPIVAGKIRDIIGAGACKLWLADAGSQELYLAKKAGEDPTVADNARRLRSPKAYSAKLPSRAIQS